MSRDERKARGMDDPVVHAAQARGRFFAAVMQAQLKDKRPFPRSSSQSYPNIPPKVDLDSDGFSSVHLCHRGADWRYNFDTIYYFQRQGLQ